METNKPQNRHDLKLRAATRQLTASNTQWRANCVKKIYYFYQTLLQSDSWLFQTATGFACRTLYAMAGDSSNQTIQPKDKIKCDKYYIAYLL